MAQKRTLFIAVLDDDPEVAESISEILTGIFRSKGQEVEIHVFTRTGEADSVAQTYDLLFLDAELENGMEWALKWKYIRKYGEVIIMAAYDGDAWESLKLRPFAFVRKRFLEKDIRNAAERYLNERSNKLPVCVIVMDGKKMVPVDPYEISYIKANGHYLDITMKDGLVVGIRNSLNNLQNILQDYGFVRIQVSYLVNISYIDKLDSKSVYLKNGIAKTISPGYKEELLKRLRFYIKSDENGKI